MVTVNVKQNAILTWKTPQPLYMILRLMNFGSQVAKNIWMILLYSLSLATPAVCFIASLYTLMLHHVLRYIDHIYKFP